MINLLKTLPYEVFTRESKLIARFVSVDSYQKIIKEASDFFNQNKLDVHEIKFILDEEGQAVIISLTVNISYALAASLSWDLTERIVLKNLDSMNLAVSLIGTHN